MNKRTTLILMSLALTVMALLFGLGQGSALAAVKTVPTCNGFDVTGTIPMYFAPSATTGTTLCTDYFGKANYANSPLPTGPVDTSLTGFAIVDGGSGYSATPTVTITDYYNAPGVVPASCSAAVTGGAVTGITCTSAGSGYIAPVVSITDATGIGAWVVTRLAATGLTGGIRKFVDALPNLKAAIATPDIVTFPGSDYYEIALVQTTWPMHSDLPPTTVRGYVQVPSGSTGCPAAPAFTYLGPTILAQKNRPVRVKFTNCLPIGAGGDLFIPVDTTYMGAGVGPDGVSPYLQNRATLHLHGGNTPWISDGTPHQWTVPLGETSTYSLGLSTQFVPDMFFNSSGKVTAVPQCGGTVTTNCWPTAVPAGLTNDPGQGSMSFYWTNQQGGRLMFYHDHAYGITRLNVYAGEAAGYLLADPAEEDALQKATVPGTLGTAVGGTTPADLGHLIPLVIQDKTFVPGAGQLAGQDPTWIWGTGTASGVNGNGDLWFPHVYTPNQNPADAGGANAFGRWDYGAWFFPPQTSLTAATPPTAVTIPCTSAAFPNQLLAPAPANNNLQGCPIIPNPSGTPEGFMDTPVINGKAYPILHVAPEAYRFKILAAGNDRSWNLQLYVADATGKDVVMLPAVPPGTGTPLPLCGSVNQLTIPALGIGLPSALMDATGNPLNGTGLAANCWPNYGTPSPGIPSKQFMWPADGRDGGVPDPRRAGPPFIQIGTEGGLLPAAVVIPSTPANYEANTRSITITNVSAHGLWVGPAERADVIVDFSKFGGKTLILYNDAPTPAPAFDMRDDYYTGDVDQSMTGGAPTTLPGYGPNTRTIMQIIVDGTPTSTTPFSLPSLKAALPSVFAATQPKPIVPEPTYPVASGGNSPTATYAGISDNTITYQAAGLPVASITVNSGGSGYSAPVVSIAPPGCAAPCATATASATVVGGVITAITLTSGGAGYTTVPLVNITDPAAVTLAGATANLKTTHTMDQKAIQELFTLDYGRMNATLGTELPLTNFLAQTTLPYGYSEWATELLQDGQTQIWKITHNGVDTHFIHFHLFNVQVLNRMGWDGSLRQPEQNELGWKDTVRMNPLEDIVVALTPMKQDLPFPLPDSIRPLDVTMPVGVVSPAISGIDPATGNAIPGGKGTTNALVNFGQEYVWHCHILGHEENDMMRPIIFQVAPPAPSNLVATANASGGVNVSWKDNSASESGFTLQRDTDPAFPAPVTLFANAGASVPNSAFGGTITYTDATVSTTSPVYYRVQAVDDFTPNSPLTLPFQTVPLTSAWVGPVSFVSSPIVGASPGSLAFGTQALGTTSSARTVTLSNTGTAPLIISSIALGGTNFSDFAQTNACPIGGTGLAAGTNCTISVTFKPTASGARSASLSISSNDPVNPTLTVSLSGTGTAPVASVSPGSLTFVTQALGTTSAARTVTLSNTGTAPLIISSIALGGTNLSDFAQTNACPIGGTGLAAGTNCTISVTFKPTVSGARSASLSISSNDPVNPTLTVSLSGAGSSVVLSPTALSFGNQLINMSSIAQVVTLTNKGATTLSSLAIAITGTNAASFTKTTTCGTSLAAGASCSISVSFRPTTAGAKIAAITITNSDPTSPQTIPLSGTGSTVSLSYTALSFGNQLINTSSVARVVTLTNWGVTTLSSLSVAVTGTNAADFTKTTTCGTSLAAGANCSISVSFRPTTAGAKIAAITITDSDPTSPQTIPLSGTGTAPVASVSPGSLAFGTQTHGTTSAAKTVTLSNTGTASLIINSIALGGSAPYLFTQTNSCPFGGAGLAPGAKCTISVSFRPSSAGSVSATLNVSVAAPATNQSVTLSGTGL